MSRHDGYLYRTFEYVTDAASGDGACVETRISFSYREGCPARIRYDENDHPAESGEWEFQSAERETHPGKWVPLLAGEWLENWCRTELDAADEDDIVRALPELEFE
jgi:hypothetical protein